MAGKRPAGNGSEPPFHSLLDLEESGPYYSSGSRAPANDDELLQKYDIDDSEEPRTSISYDQFVGSGPSQHPGGPTHTSTGLSVNRPYASTGNNRLYSQSSELQNYSRYHDGIDEDDDRSMDRYYSNGGGIDESSASHGAVQDARKRGGLLGIGGGMMGKARNMLGMSPHYSEMDLPLTDNAQRVPRVDTGDSTATKKSTQGGFKFGFGRRKPDPSTLGPRQIHLNNPPANASSKFIDNHISTAKYNIATFLPKFLYEQFSKYANVFFLFTAILQQIPNISPTNKYTTIAPLILVLLVSAAKEVVEDLRRKSSDSILNNSPTRVLRGSSFIDTKWIKVAVGDVVRIESEEAFPADLILLASSEPEGLCYIETANLDGETNLKIKQAIPETAHLVSQAELGRLSGRITSEQPNSSLYTYEGTITMQAGGGERELSLSPEQLLLRGATLRNTPWIHGVVVFTGHETKLMRNATATPIKKTAVEKMLNKQILLLGAILVTLSVISSIGDLIIRLRDSKSFWYLEFDSLNAPKQFFSDLLTYWVLYSNLVPISLFVTVEIVKYAQAYLIGSDLDIYYDQTDTPANCRTSSLVEELGQIEYIFSDKTGTLTCNQMDFRQCSIGGIQYADDVPEDRRATVQDGMELGIHDFKQLDANLKTHRTKENMHQFLTLLSICHTVIPERTSEKPEGIKYQAASPDEGALVEGAALLGYRFIARKPRSVTITHDGREYDYELLAVCEFNSTRKRMSAIFRCPDDKIRIYCKGADTVIMERLYEGDPLVETTNRHLEEYASEGLRTLCLAMREVTEQEFEDWFKVYTMASTTVGGNRADELDKAAEIIEHDFTLLGATAIEDKLQDGVPDTIHTLQTAGIKVWVLTGDRQETAINIGMSCKLISEDMTLLIVNEENKEGTRENMEKKLNAIRSQSASQAELETLALVIDGKSLTFALERDLEKSFLDLAVMCKAVICCRVSPLQKALVVKLVKRHLKAILLAIGDGANDVSMIQAAHIGVGISGMEGLQAARSADVSIGQFRYLRKLLLVHGSWSYHRVSKVILYSFYKNVALFMTQFWYSFQNGFSGQTIYESWTLSSFNVLFTLFPPFAIGLFDQFVSARLLDRYPQLYQLSQSGVFFRMRSFIAWVSNGFYHSFLLYAGSVLIWSWDHPQPDGRVAGHWVWGTALYTTGLMLVLLKAALVVNIWTKYTVLAIPGSFVLWIGLIPLYIWLAPMAGISPEFQGLNTRLWGDPTFYATVLLLPPICLLRDLTWK
jgi:phospholipid-transporting ATPase